MAKIKKIKEGTATVYPATIPQAVIDPTSGKSVRTELNEKFDKTSLESARSQSTTKAPTSKLLDDELNKVMPYEEFTEFTRNLFDKNAVIEGSYINNNTGNLSGGDGAVSPLIPVVAGEIYYLSGRNMTAAGYEVRFLTSSGTPLKPYNEAGVESGSYSYVKNGSMMAPPNAVHVQFTVRLTTYGGTYEAIQFEKGSLPTEYIDYKRVIKESAFYDVAKESELIVVENTANNNQYDINVIRNGLAKRINTNENTAAPGAFNTAADASGGFSITVSQDTESPLKDYVGYKRVFLTNLQVGNGSSYGTWTLPLANQARPSKIGMAFWTKKSEFQAIYVSNFQSYLGLCTFSLNPTLAFSGIPVISTGSVASSVELSAGKLEFSVIAEVGDYVRIRLLYYDLVWKGTFTGSSMTFYWLFNGSYANGKPLTFIDFTVLLGESPVGSYIYPDNGTLTGSQTLKGAYDIGNSNSVRISALENASYGAGVRVKKSGNMLYIASPWNETYDLVKAVEVIRTSSFTNNPVANFINEYLCAKNGDPSGSAVAIKGSGDDICPANLNNSYIGGNHSWNQGLNVVSNGHGKTLADVGSVYKNASDVEFVILRVVDANNLWMISKNQAVDGFSYSFATPSGTLTYLSNGVNTGDIVVGSASSLGNTCTTVAPAVVKMVMDGKVEIASDGTYYGKYLDVIESYDALDLPSIVQQLTANRPVDGYNTQPQLNELAGTESLFNHSINYRFTKNGNTVVNTTFRAYKKLAFNFHGFIQSSALSSGNIYCPKSLPITVGATTYDLRQVSDWTNAPSASINLTSEYWENPLSPPDRVMNMNSNVNLMLGYITDRGIQSSRKDVVNNTMFLNTTRKIYPMGVSVASNLEANSFYSCTAYRSYTNPANNPTGRTNYCWVEAGLDVFIFLDYHGALNDKIVPEAEWVGRKITVYEKNDKCSLIGDVVSGHIEIISTASANDYGFIVLKIS